MKLISRKEKNSNFDIIGHSTVFTVKLRFNFLRNQQLLDINSKYKLYSF